MDAYIQLYDQSGEPTAEKVDRHTIGLQGLLHGAAHVWIWRKNDNGGVEVLLQKRSVTKQTWPGRLDISAAGHIDYGESPLATAKRETSEEINLDIDQGLELLFVNRSTNHVPDTDYIENEIRWVYGYQLPKGRDVRGDGDEVSGLEWMSIEQFSELAHDPRDVFVPKSEAYLAGLIDYLHRA